jgi:hypothetical protein
MVTHSARDPPGSDGDHRLDWLAGSSSLGNAGPQQPGQRLCGLRVIPELVLPSMPPPLTGAEGDTGYDMT